MVVTRLPSTRDAVPGGLFVHMLFWHPRAFQGSLSDLEDIPCLNGLPAAAASAVPNHG